MDLNKIIIIIFISLFSNEVIASSPSSKLGWHWMWDKGCINFDMHHPYKHLMKRKFGDKAGEKMPDSYTPLYYLEIWEDVFTKIHSALPHLSPREEEWIQEELNSKDSKRRIAVFKKIEYFKYNLSNLVHSKLTLIKSYKNELNEKKKKKILYRFAWFLKTYSVDFANSYIQLFNRDLISSLPNKFDKIKLFKNGDDIYIDGIKEDWERAHDFITKCYIAGYK